MIKLSVTIIAFNEEKNIRCCLDSVKDLADEIVVVDSFSTDQTEQICQEFGVRFIRQSFLGHVGQKNFALDQTAYEYILHLDADEALGPELAKSVQKLKQNWVESAYSFNRLTNYSGHWVKHCGWYPDTKVRLWKKGTARWGGDNPHDIIIVNPDQTVGHVTGDLLHYSYNSISEHVQQTNSFTTIAAEVAYKKGLRSNYFKIFSRPLLKFVRDYFLKLGILDGRYGFYICYINALSAFLKYSKLFELQISKKR